MAVGINLWFMMRNPMARFWRVAARRPEAVLERIRASEAWVVFEDELPADFRSSRQKDQWVGPFRLDLPQTPKRVMVLGRANTYRESAAQILAELKSGRH
ncbi:MAG TPA: hypothetical protein ENN40_09100 [Candidatus Aminicenantes bacterium]|nr:hypothetical protein [Candidatus Aminicenantes bacterium]